MATIEERANKYESAHNHRNIFIAYADGAADQKQIDIDKACDNLVASFLKSGMSEENVIAFVSQFRKAMESEL